MDNWVDDLYTRVPQKHCMICSDDCGRPIELEKEWASVLRKEYFSREVSSAQEVVGLVCPVCGLRYKILEKKL